MACMSLSLHMTREAFDSYGVMFNARANQMRKRADADAAAEEGIRHIEHSTIHVPPSNNQTVTLHSACTD